jgi:3-methyladenine DNA glycosylase/8-oxoguanine DNA glycosylase
MPTSLVRSQRPISPSQTLGDLQRGGGDPTMRSGRGQVVRASRTPEGPVTARFVPSPEGVEVEAWGPGSGWLLERAAAWCGALDDDSGFDPPRGLVREVWRRTPGFRIARTGLITERLVASILEQKVTGIEARRAYRRLTVALAEPAPGPFDLLLPPDPARIAELPYHAFHPFGVERRRTEVLRAACPRASWLDEGERLPLRDARARLGGLSGVGPWTVAEVARVALGDADAVSVGDFHLKHLVSWALAREPRGTDERMLELLEPYRPHRGRVQRLLELSGIRAPAFGPRMEPRAIERL